jgi:hypothetical protein
MGPFTTDQLAGAASECFDTYPMDILHVPWSMWHVQPATLHHWSQRITPADMCHGTRSSGRKDVLSGRRCTVCPSLQ